MIRKHNIWMVVVAALLVMSLVAIGCAPKAEAPPGKEAPTGPIGTIFVGLIGDMTGPTASACLPETLAHIGTMDDINKQGGLTYNDPKTGRQETVMFQYDWGDCKGDAGLVPSIYKRINQKNPLAWITSTSAASVVAAPLAAKDRALWYGLGTTPNLLDPYNPYTFGTISDYRDWAGFAFKYMADDWKAKGNPGRPKAAWFTMDIPFGRAPMTPAVDAYAKRIGVDIVGKWFHAPLPTDLTSELTAIVNAGANYTYGNESEVQGAIICKEVARLGLRDKLTTVLCGPCQQEGFVQMAGPAGNDVPMVGMLPSRTDLSVPKVKFFYDRAERIGKDWNWALLAGLVQAEWAMQSMKMALEAKGWPITADDLVEVLEAGHNWNLCGPHPTMYTSKEDHWLFHEACISSWRKGKEVFLTDWGTVPVLWRVKD